MARKVLLAVAVLLAAAGCGGDPAESAAPAGPIRPAAFWITPAPETADRYGVARAVRELDVCALAPRARLAKIGTVGEVTTGLYTCNADLGDGGATRLYWSSMLLADAMPPGRGMEFQTGGAAVRVVPDREQGTPQACGATVRFPSGAAFYLGTSVPAGGDACVIAEKLVPDMVANWLAGPPQGTSPDTQKTVLLGADPCAVRASLPGSGEVGPPRLNACRFGYRGEDVIVTYEYRVPSSLTAHGHGEQIDGRPVQRSESIYDATIPLFTAAVGPELPPGTTDSGPRIPVVEVAARTDPVAREVMGRVLALFPAR
ncbi:peptidase [Nocardia thailandica]|uniref:Peptidase n=1 Tax=Nocardia thailandica TaxID=257275 RepID=A0ABW6PUI6_9NOCA